MAAIVWHAAKTIQKFMDDKSDDGELALCSGVRVRLDNLVLLGLLRVTPRSYQILLGLRP